MMHFKDSRSSTHSAAVLVPDWDAYFCQSCGRYVLGRNEILFLLVVLTSAVQEYPDRMLATFSIFPSPKVSETVVEVSQATPKVDLCDDIWALFIDSHTMHCSPFTSS